MCIFLLTTVVSSLFIHVKVGGAVKKYFINDWDHFTTSLFSGLMTFLLIWILVFDIVHIF